jgi:hypothetical protein
VLAQTRVSTDQHEDPEAHGRIRHKLRDSSAQRVTTKGQRARGEQGDGGGGDERQLVHPHREAGVQPSVETDRAVEPQLADRRLGSWPDSIAIVCISQRVRVQGVWGRELGLRA